MSARLRYLAERLHKIAQVAAVRASNAVPLATAEADR